MGTALVKDKLSKMATLPGDRAHLVTLAKDIICLLLKLSYFSQNTSPGKGGECCWLDKSLGFPSGPFFLGNVRVDKKKKLNEWIYKVISK